MASPHTRGGRAPRARAAPTRCVVNRERSRSARTSWQIPTAESNGVQSPSVRLPIFYGWIIVACTWLANFTTAGTNPLVFAFFIAPMTAELHVGRSELVIGITLRMIAGGLFAPVLGRIVDRYGARWPLVASAALGVLGLLVPYFLPAMPMLFAGMALCGIWAVVNLILTQSLIGAFSTKETLAQAFSRLMALVSAIVLEIAERSKPTV